MPELLLQSSRKFVAAAQCRLTLKGPMPDEESEIEIRPLFEAEDFSR